MRLADALNDRASFRRFCGFATHEPTPERTALVRFRGELVRRGLDRALFGTVTRQLDARGVVVRTGTLVDATLIASASIGHDHEARWAGHRRRKPVHGYKAHVATDQDAALIRGVEITTANVHDAAELEAVLPPEPGDVFGDSAYASSRSEQVIAARRSGAHRANRRLGRRGSVGSRAGAQCRGARAARPHRESVWHLQAQLRSAPDALVRPGQGGPASPADAIAYNLRRSWRLLQPMQA